MGGHQSSPPGQSLGLVVLDATESGDDWKGDRVAPALQYTIHRLSEYAHFLDAPALDRIVGILRGAYLADACIYVAGNGGSAATAAHWVNDLHKTSMRPGRKGVRALTLADNVSLVTAFANDEGYASVFRQQLATHARPGDVLVVISVSGSSPNLVEVAQLALSMGMPVVGLLGWDGGALVKLATEAVVVPAPPGEYPIVESMHALLCDALCESVTRSIEMLG